MKFEHSIETLSPIKRKITFKIPKTEVSQQFERELISVQKKAKVKGFREGMVPMDMVRKMYGQDVRHQLFHTLVDQSYRKVLTQERIRAIGQPQIESSKHQHGAHEHDHGASENSDFEYSATVEVLPEVELKGYKGLNVPKNKLEVTDTELADALKNIQGRLATVSKIEDQSVAAKNGDQVDLTFEGALEVDGKLEPRKEMSGRRTIELGAHEFIDGFEEQVVGLKPEDTKTFQIRFPKDYFEESYRNTLAEFKVTIHSISNKELPELNDDFAKQAGKDSLDALKVQIREDLLAHKTSENERNERSQLLTALTEKNPLEVPQGLIMTQARMLAQEVSQNLNQQGFTPKMVEEALKQEMPQILKRAEAQVKASLLLEAVAKKENIETDASDIDAEVKKLSAQYRVDEAKIREHFLDDEGRREDLAFRLREDKAIQFLKKNAKWN